MASRTYESRMNAAVKAGEWDVARELYEERFRGKWGWDEVANCWLSRDGSGQMLSVAKEKQSRQQLEIWLQAKMAERQSSKSVVPKEEDEPLQRKRSAPRSSSAFQDTASLISTARGTASARNAFVPSASFAESGKGGRLGASVDLDRNVRPKPEEQQSFAESGKGHLPGKEVEPATSFVEEVAKVVEVQEPERVVEEDRLAETVSNEEDIESSEAPAVELPAETHAVPQDQHHEEHSNTQDVSDQQKTSSVEEERSQEVEEPVVQERPIETVAPTDSAPVPESLSIAGESAFVGRRIVSTFNPEALPTAGEIDALQALQYPVYKVQPAQWSRLAALGSMILVDPCMRPNTTFLLMKHSKSNGMVRVYQEGKPATNAMDWREICAVYEDLYPSSSLDLDQLTKVVRKKLPQRSKRV